MGTAEMVGSMGLTFFCNKCVELFYKFRKDEEVSDDLRKVCQEAISAFKSLKWPNGGHVGTDEKVSLFNTNEEVKSFDRMLRAECGEVDDAALEKWIGKLDGVIKAQVSIEEKKRNAQELQEFFDTLGDYSFLATKECLRAPETLAGI